MPQQIYAGHITDAGVIVPRCTNLHNFKCLILHANGSIPKTFWVTFNTNFGIRLQTSGRLQIFMPNQSGNTYICIYLHSTTSFFMGVIKSTCMCFDWWSEGVWLVSVGGAHPFDGQGLNICGAVNSYVATLTTECSPPWNNGHHDTWYSAELIRYQYVFN